ncbi:MAG: dihydrofolate reductase, partial [Pseudolabrys sp.]|nr:dihydrofolate reductase [Pseudolabrys sp.]
DKPVVMGRKTYESIGKPLPGRTNIVMTKDLGLVVPGGVLANSLDAAMSFARQDAERRGVDEIMVIGGGDVFERIMPRADRLEITHVNASPEGDAFFPQFDPTLWRETKRVSFPAGPDDDASFDVATYVRR